MTSRAHAEVVVESNGILDLAQDSDFLNPGPDDPDFRMTVPLEDIQKRSADIRTGRVMTIPWEEAKREGHAIRG